MTPVEAARQRYLNCGTPLAVTGRHCVLCNRIAHAEEAASVALDMAVAASFTERTRGSVAW